jgi:hypothetical protein
MLCSCALAVRVHLCKIDRVPYPDACSVCRYECAEGSNTITAHFRPVRTSITAAAAAAGAPDAEQPQAPDNCNGVESAQPQDAAASTKGITVTARLLVAADGYFSRVRRQCLADGPPEVSHTCLTHMYCTCHDQGSPVNVVRTVCRPLYTQVFHASPCIKSRL